MSTVTFKDQLYTLELQESVLQCLIRHEVDYPNSCQAGICQSCLIKVKDGIVNPDWQEGLPDTLKTKVYVCGPKETTDKLKKQIFLAGVPSQAILSDVFL